MVDNPNQKFGEVVSAAMDGEALDAKKPSYKLPGKTNKSLDDITGHTRSTQGGYFKAEIFLSATMDSGQLQGKTGFTFYFELDTGQAYSCPNAWVEGDIEPSPEGFPIEIRFKTANQVKHG